VSVLLEAAAAAAGISQEFIVLIITSIEATRIEDISSSCSFAAAWVGVDGPFTTSFCCNSLIYWSSKLSPDLAFQTA
jgi:hypothetical protein